MNDNRATAFGSHATLELIIKLIGLEVETRDDDQDCQDWVYSDGPLI